MEYWKCTDAQIAAAVTPGRAAAMWWTREIKSPVWLVLFWSGKLKAFESNLADSLDNWVDTGEVSDDDEIEEGTLSVCARSDGKVSAELLAACTVSGFRPKDVEWPDVPPMLVSRDAVYFRDASFGMKTIWVAEGPNDPATALKAA